MSGGGYTLLGYGAADLDALSRAGVI